MTYVKVMGQPLATETPSERKQRATEIVNDFDPMDRMVDGLSVRECLERYQAWQREDVSQVPGRPVSGRWSMAEPDQARRAASTCAVVRYGAELKRKQNEARAKERGEVTVQDQWGDDD